MMWDEINYTFEVHKDLKNKMNFDSDKEFFDYLKIGDDVELINYEGNFEFINGKKFKIAGKSIKKTFGNNFYSIRLDKNFKYKGLVANNLHCSWIKISLRKQKFKRILNR